MGSKRRLIHSHSLISTDFLVLVDIHPFKNDAWNFFIYPSNSGLENNSISFRNLHSERATFYGYCSWDFIAYICPTHSSICYQRPAKLSRTHEYYCDAWWWHAFCINLRLITLFKPVKIRQKYVYDLNLKIFCRASF